MRHFDPEVGHKLGQYELLAPVAKGGMAQVWAARPVGTRGYRHVVAVKTILPGRIDDARLEQMFLQEGAIAPRLCHPNLVKAIELGEQDGVLYLVMEWVDGEPLHVLSADAREDGGLPLDLAVGVVSRALRGLHVAHELCDESGAPLGLVHRDLSPQNIMVTARGEVKLVDFGIAKATELESSLTDDGEIKGKYAYVSPEQVAGRKLDRRSDVFAAGVLLYMLTTGQHPFKGDTAAETINRICTEPARSPATVRPGYPPALAGVLLKALAKTRDTRWESAAALADALDRALPVTAGAGFETRLAEYVQRLAGGRAAERLDKLRLAEQRLEREQSEGSNPMLAAISQGSLRALSIERVGSEIVIHAEADASFDALSLGLTERVEPERPRVRWMRSAAFGAALLAAGVFVGLGARFAVSEPSPELAAASPVPAVTLAPGGVVASRTEPITEPVAAASAAAAPEQPSRDASGAAARNRPATVKPKPKRAKPASAPAPALSAVPGVDVPGGVFGSRL